MARRQNSYLVATATKSSSWGQQATLEIAPSWGQSKRRGINGYIICVCFILCGQNKIKKYQKVSTLCYKVSTMTKQGSGDSDWFTLCVRMSLCFQPSLWMRLRPPPELPRANHLRDTARQVHCTYRDKQIGYWTIQAVDV